MYTFTYLSFKNTHARNTHTHTCMFIHTHTFTHTHTLLQRRATDRDSTVLVVAFISLQLLDSTERMIHFYNELYNDKEAVHSGSVLLDS